MDDKIMALQKCKTITKAPPWEIEIIVGRDIYKFVRQEKAKTFEHYVWFDKEKKLFYILVFDRDDNEIALTLAELPTFKNYLHSKMTVLVDEFGGSIFTRSRAIATASDMLIPGYEASDLHAQLVARMFKTDKIQLINAIIDAYIDPDPVDGFEGKLTPIRNNPNSWIKDEDIWKKAKGEVVAKYGEPIKWALVQWLYFKMGGRKK